jgi:hypothetical protein
MHRLPLNSDVLVWREGGTGYPGKWRGPYKLISIDGETCTIELPNRPTKFRSTVIKPYYKDDDLEQQDAEQLAPKKTPATAPLDALPPPLKVVILPYEPDDAEAQPPRPQRKHHLPSRYRDDIAHLQQIARLFLQIASDNQFDESRHREVTRLLERDIFIAVNQEDIPPEAHIYSFRFINKVKNKGTDKAFKKSRLVVQAYNDKDKEFVLTQSPTIQHSSQHLILSIRVNKHRVQF